MKKLILGICLLCMISSWCFCQEASISKATEKIVLNTTMQAVESYTRYMELYAGELDAELADIYKAELLKLIEKDSIYVFNDLIPKENRPTKADQNIDVFLTYLDDIRSRYLDGVKITYKNYQPSVVFNDKLRSRMFMKITADRKIDGIYHYKNSKIEHTAIEAIDFYVGVNLQESGVPVIRIYSVMNHQENERDFIPVKVVEKSIPIVFNPLEISTIMKRGKEQKLVWEGGEVYERLNLELHRKSYPESILYQVIDSTFFNDNSLSFTFNEKTKPGNDFFLRINKLDSEESGFDTGYFKIKRRVPTVLKVAIPIILGLGVSAVIYYSRTDTEPELPASPGLPE